MSVKTNLYKGGVLAASATQLIITIDDLDTLMEDNSAAILDIWSWAYDTSNPDNIIEISSFTYRQLLIKKASGTITIANTRVIEDNTNLTGSGTIDWYESMSGNDIELYCDIGGFNADIFRRAIVTMLKA